MLQVPSAAASNRLLKPGGPSDIVQSESTAKGEGTVTPKEPSRPDRNLMKSIFSLDAGTAQKVRGNELPKPRQQSAMIPSKSKAKEKLEIKTHLGEIDERRNALQAKRRREQSRRTELLRRRQHQKVEEARRLLRELEGLQEEVKTLDKLRRLPQEVERLRRTHAAQQDEVAMLRRQIEQVTRQRRSDASSGPATSYHSPTPTSASPSGMRHNYNRMKRRPQLGNPRTTDFTFDVESQPQYGYSSEERTYGQLNPNMASINNSNPLASVVILLRKIVVDVLTDQDDEALGREDTSAHILIITLLVEGIAAILLAFAALAFTLFIYDHFVPDLPTAHNYQGAASVLMNDTQTLKDFEAEKGLKFMEMHEYASIMQEIGDAANKIRTAETTARSRLEHIAEMKREMETGRYADKIPEFISSLQLDQYCGDCIWSVSQKMSCAMRVKALRETYKTPKFEAMLVAMEKPSCVKTDKQEATELWAKVNALLQDWDANQNDFCPGCEWEEGMSCQVRIKYMHETYGMEVKLATAELMVKSRQCTHSYTDRINSEHMDHFCGECMWSVSEKVTCSMHVNTLQVKYNSPKNKAVLSAMKKASCKKKPEQVKEEKELQAKVDVLFQNWDANQKDFCPECIWDVGTSCQSRVKYLHEIYGLEVKLATAELMIKSRQCSHSYNENPELISSLQLDYFCGECMWSVSQKVTCSMRVNTLQVKYNTHKHEAMVLAMEKPSCKKSKRQVREEKEVLAKVDELLQDWDTNQKDFCPKCIWDESVPCQMRLKYLHETHGMEVKLATAELMIKSKQCRHSHNNKAHISKEMISSLQLDYFCGECMWSVSQKVTCFMRVNTLQLKYKNHKHEAMVSAMEKPSCKKTDEQVREGKELQAKVDALFQDWDAKQMDFCPECEWDVGMPCHLRIKYLHETHGMELKLAMAELMIKSRQCTHSYHEEERRKDDEKLTRFCSHCEWEHNTSCGQHVDYLMSTYKVAERASKLSTMDKPTCILEKTEGN